MLFCAVLCCAVLLGSMCSGCRSTIVAGHKSGWAHNAAITSHHCLQPTHVLRPAPLHVQELEAIGAGPELDRLVEELEGKSLAPSRR